MESTYFAIAFLAGLVPALFWLWFWLREDNKHPEPYALIVISFIAGMAVVPLALPLQKLAIELYTDSNLILVWVIVEEILKYAAALIIVLWNKEVNEPIDMVIYMIVIALGFSALENSLFIFSPLSSSSFVPSVSLSSATSDSLDTDSLASDSSVASLDSSLTSSFVLVSGSVDSFDSSFGFF